MLPAAPLTRTHWAGPTPARSRRKNSAVVAPSTAATARSYGRFAGFGASDAVAGSSAYSALWSGHTLWRR
jgi:hypothetical protein